MDGLVLQAEQALLGAILLDPAGQQQVADLVRREDMQGPYHGQVLAAMQRARKRGQAPGLLEVYEELKRDPDLPRGVSHDGVLLAALADAAPCPWHAPAYAAMVIEGGIRRQLAVAGSRMAQAAGDDGADLDAALHVSGLACRELDGCRARWQALPEHVRQDPPILRSGTQRHAASFRPGGRLLDDRPAPPCEAGQQLAPAGPARPQGAEAEAAGARAVRELAAGPPSQIGAVARWLRPRHFARPEHGELFAVLRDLHAAGRPADRVTAGWEAARRGIGTDAADLSGGMGPQGVQAAREVYRYGLLAQIAQAGHGIQADAADPALRPPLLLRAVGHRLRLVGLEAALAPPGQSGRRPGDRDAAVVTIGRSCAGRPDSREPGREAVP